MRARWFPGTTERPQTAFTFNVLDFYLELNWAGKVNLRDFYQALENLTNKTGIDAQFVSTPQLYVNIQ